MLDALPVNNFLRSFFILVLLLPNLVHSFLPLTIHKPGAVNLLLSPKKCSTLPGSITFSSIGKAFTIATECQQDGSVNFENTLDNQEDEDEILIRRISEEVMAESGVQLDQLINPSKVVNLERDIASLRKQLLISGISSEEREAIDVQIEKKQSVLFVEKRAVMRGWLKNLFVGQSVLACGISMAMVYNAIPNYDLDISIKVLGFWMWWLFIIPSLR